MGQWDTRLVSPVVAFLQPLQAEAACVRNHEYGETHLPFRVSSWLELPPLTVLPAFSSIHHSFSPFLYPCPFPSYSHSHAYYAFPHQAWGFLLPRFLGYHLNSLYPAPKLKSCLSFKPLTIKANPGHPAGSLAGHPTESSTFGSEGQSKAPPFWVFDTLKFFVTLHSFPAFIQDSVVKVTWFRCH